MVSIQMKRYSVLYADPPWDYAGKTQQNGKVAVKSAVDHYPTMKLNELKDLNIKDLCEPDCVLFLWTSSPHLPQAIELMTAWGFEYKTIAFVWDKQKTNPGYYTLSRCEVCIVGKKGKFPQPRGSRKEHQFLSEMRGKHSKKPDEIRKRITKMFPTQAKIELFAREAVEGWDRWGNEVQSSLVVERVDAGTKIDSANPPTPEPQNNTECQRN
jgi:N6-adenosine-specific RNA methylase IME4